MLILFVIVLLLLFLLTGWLLIKSPGKTAPFFDESGRAVEGSINEKIYVNINGTNQGMFIRGKDVSNPVLLFLHGGPGMPEYAFFEKYEIGLQNVFTVCWWEQRGAGLSYESGMSGEITTEQMICDVLEVTDYLRGRFGRDKIYLMAHSGGTFFGIQAAARSPERYEAYVGIGQISDQRASEKQAYDYMLEQFRAAGNEKMVRELKKYPIYKSAEAFYVYSTSMLRDKAMHMLGIGTMHDMSSVVKGIFLTVMQCPAYTFKEKINIWRGKKYLNNESGLRKSINSTDLSQAVTSLQIPVYFFSGAYDYTVSYTGSKEYLRTLVAVTKGFYTFSNSAHSPLFEQPERFIKILTDDVLPGITELADRN